MRRIILVDIDHTLRNAFPRDHMIGNTSWDEYHAAAESEEPLHDVVELINTLVVAGYTAVGVTAIPEKWRQFTMRWLMRHNIKLCRLLMRPDAAFHPAPEIKVKLAKEEFGEDLNEKIAFILEDRDDVCMAFRDLGITVLQVHGRQK